MLEGLAQINPSQRTREYWDGCKKRELRFQRCIDCGHFRFPPLSGCRDCGGTRAEWVPVSGRGRVFSYTIVVHPAIPQISEDVPYNVVVVEFDDAPGARMISNVLDVEPDEVQIGMELELAWDESAPGVVLPRFRPAS